MKYILDNCKNYAKIGVNSLGIVTNSIVVGGVLFLLSSSVIVPFFSPSDIPFYLATLLIGISNIDFARDSLDNISSEYKRIKKYYNEIKDNRAMLKEEYAKKFTSIKQLKSESIKNNDIPIMEQTINSPEPVKLERTQYIIGSEDNNRSFVDEYYAIREEIKRINEENPINKEELLDNIKTKKLTMKK